MKQHPVPQNIASYQFRLVGDMTLKQFLQLAAGGILAYLCFHLNIPSFIKWPLVSFFGLLGLALAFLPIEGRPLDKWIINFIKSIYSPTRFLWQKNNPPPAFLQTRPKTVSKTRPKEPLEKSKAVLKEYLETLAPLSSASPRAAVRQSADFDDAWLGQKEKKQMDRIERLLKNPLAAQALSPGASVESADMVKPAPPLTPPIRVESAFPFKQKVKPEVVAMFPNQVPMPAPSDTPNIVVGMVLTPDERILPNSLIEIKDIQGNALRALKANKLGQFSTTAPLDNGSYKIQAEHEDYQFDIIDLKAEGKIIPPVRIKARSTVTN